MEWKESLLSVAQDGSLRRPQGNQNYGEKTLWRQTGTDGIRQRAAVSPHTGKTKHQL